MIYHATTPFAIETARHNAAIPIAQRRGGNWKGAILIGAVAGLAFGGAVASQDGDEGSDRSTGDRLKSGLLAGAMIAVPVTVIVALVTGEKSQP
ncbi:MAG TPA: hypothetical protein PLL69_08760 [Gemmatimonadales bacterium]|nr:hypothetical protein [Gemmatimonadales bacterium]